MSMQRRTMRVYLAFSILLVLFAVSGCGPGPQPTPTLSPVALTLDVNPNVKEIEAGQTVGIVVRVTTGEAASLRWSVTGNSGGRVSPETGDAVFYTAGNPGVDIVTAEGTTAKGAPVKERVSFNVVPASKVTQVPPTFTPMPLTVTPLPPTATPSPPTATTVPLGGCSSFTSPRLIRPRLPRTSSGATGSFSAPQHCEIGVPAGVGLSVGGTATNVPSSSFLWLLVYASGNYYPQCNNVYKGICGANLSEGVWAVMAFIGKKDCKEHIHLVLVTMNQSDNNQLTQQMVQKASSGDFAFARNELPPSVEEVASIEIETAGRICP